MTANTSQLARLFQLMTSVAELVIRGSRDAERVSAVLQRVKESPNFDEVSIEDLVIRRNRDAVVKPRKGVRAFLRDWQTLYRQEFGIEIDISKIRIPKRVPGFNRLIVVAQGLTPEKIVSVLKGHMTVWKYADNLDTVKSDRKTDQPYAIWIRDRQEADEELKNKSANQLQQEGVNCITLEERLLYHLKYFLETGKHLDEKNWTLCAGSRDPDGGVPEVVWGPGGGVVGVGWCGPSVADSGLRARSVVS